MTDKILIDRSVVEQALNIMTHMLALDLRNDYNLLTVSEYEMIRAEAVKLRENLEQAQAGEVVVTTNQQGQCVAVTRQDEEGHILSVIWEAKQPQVEHEPVAWMTEDGRVANGEHNASSSVKRRITRAIERAHGIGGEA